MGITAKKRATTSLFGTTQLQGAQVVDIITTIIRDDKQDHLSPGFWSTVKFKVVEESRGESESSAVIELFSGIAQKRVGTFRVSAEGGDAERINFKVGGLDRYTTKQDTFLLIPFGPKKIVGFGPYKKLLNLAMAAVEQRDPTASLQIQQDQ